MNLPKYSLDNRKVVYFFLLILIVGGVYAFQALGKKEDSPFVIKQVVLTTQYQGATPIEVEKLVTEPIERELQSLRRTKKIKSDSYYGMSKITIELDPSTPAEEIPQMWDELRRKVMNIEPKLPAGASKIMVGDDFGDVYGIYYSLVIDDDFTYADGRKWAEFIKTNLVPIEGVEKVQLTGIQTEVVNLYIPISKLANLGVDPNIIVQTLQSQNKVVNTGEKDANQLRIKVVTNGTFKSLDDIRNQEIATPTGQAFKIGDIATIEKGYLDPPSVLMRVNGKKAIGIGIATAMDKDVVATGKEVRAKLDQIMPQIPVGLSLEPIYLEDVIANDANNGFIINLLESVAIVIIIIMLVMGMRAGIIIGSSLLFAIGGTLLIMQLISVGLNRTSLAGFIIAMGMLVDNAIVVTDNAQVAMKKGGGKIKSIINGATGPQWGLLGATLIAIFSFLPLYLAPSAVAEIVKPLFIVIGISLGLSWVLALTQTPLFEDIILKEEKGEEKDPYDTKFYNKFSRIITKMIKFKYLSMAIAFGAFVFALVIMSLLPQNFFPNIDKPYFRADLFLPEGYSIYETERNIKQVENYLTAQPGVKKVSASLGSSPLRYYLASSSFGPKPNFANVLVELHSSDSTKAIEDRFAKYMRDNYPDILTRSSLFKLSPAVESAIEIGFIGDNIDTLTALSERAQALMRKNPIVTDVRSSWGNRIPVLIPEYYAAKGYRLGVGRTTMANGLKVATTGLPIGDYREDDQTMPILLKSDNINKMPINQIRTLPIFSTNGKVIPLEQVVDTFKLNYDISVLKRYNRERIILAQCDPLRGGNTHEAFASVWKDMQEKIAIPEGYQMKYFGEQDSQDESNSSIGANVPLMFLLMFIILLLLFRNYKQPTIIMLMLPLIFIGVVLGLATFGKSLDFFAMLGVLGLIGMNIKNAIVLVDQINIENTEGKQPLDALISATKSRIVPVTMASGTTILGMAPLLFDALFGGMAAAIMGGLLVASLLTLFVLPVTYAIFYKIKA